jgi:predicted metalloendopeptidase
MEKGINLEFLDPSIKPGDDFYQFVNGGWMRTTEIPADRSSWGSFHELSKNTDRKVLDILENELATPGPAENKAARLFETGMDTQSIEKNRLSAIQDFFNKLENFNNPDKLPQLLGEFSGYGFGPLVHHSVHPDLGNSRIYASYIEAPNLGLPEREYYLDQDEKAANIRNKYKEYIAVILEKEANYPKTLSVQLADDILSLETALADHMLSKEERRQMDKLYNPHTPEQLKKLMPDWDWATYFSALGIEIPGQIIVTEPAFFAFLNTYLKETRNETLKYYFRFLLIHRAAPFAHAALEEANFELYGKTLEGTEVMRPREERLVKLINQSLGELLGQLFVSRYFPASAKATALEMTQDIVEAFKNRITQLEWMSETTKQYALEKLAAFKVKIGYPDKWKDYSELVIESNESGGNYLQNIISFGKWKTKIELGRIGKEVDREEWFMPPQMVNAYYNPMFNEIVFPAAILQPPFFDWEADAAVNYGGIGAVIGHEITHGFDDQGGRFDKEGNLNEWWTAEDRDRFKELTSQLIQQFDAYYPFEDMSLNGTFTLGENIADLGGLSVAYDALQLYYKRHGRPGPINCFTADQRFFMSWATVWRTKIRPEALRNQIKTDPHAPGLYRAVAAPSNMASFYNAFELLPGSKWYRPEEERIKIW